MSDYTLAEMRAALAMQRANASQGANPQLAPQAAAPQAAQLAPPPASKDDEPTLEELRAALDMRLKMQASRGFLGEVGHKARLGAESVAKGALGLVDLGAMVGNSFHYATKKPDYERLASMMLEAKRIGPKETLNKVKSKIENWDPRSKDVEKFIDVKSKIQNWRPPSQDIKKFINDKIGLNLDSQQAEDVWDRFIQGGGEFAGAVAGGNALGAFFNLGGGTLSSIVKQVLKGTAGAAATGVASKALQEAGVNPVVADIAAIATPAVYQGARRVIGKSLIPELSTQEQKVAHAMAEEIRNNPRAKIANSASSKAAAGDSELATVIDELGVQRKLAGYEPTSAESSLNPALIIPTRDSKSLLHGAVDKSGELHAAISAAVENIAPGASIEATKELFDNIVNSVNARTTEALGANFAEKMSAAQAGRIVRAALRDELLQRKATRALQSGPLYKEAEKVSTKISPDNALDAATEAFNESGFKPTKNKFSNLMDMLGGKEAKSMEAALEPYKHLPPDKLNAIRENYIQQLQGNSGYIPKALIGKQKELNGAIGAAQVAGDDNLTRQLTKIKRGLEKDLEGVPEVAKANKVYSEYSPAVDALKNDEVIGSMIRTGKGNKFLKTYTGKIPANITTDPEVTTNFLEAMKTLKTTNPAAANEAVKGIQANMNRQFVNFVTDEYGQFDPSKLAAWKKHLKNNHPGIFDIDPHLETKLGNVSNSRALFNRTNKGILKDIDNYYKNAFEAVANEDLNKVVNKIIGGNNGIENARRAVELTRLDKSGNALVGLQNTFANNLFSRSLNKSSNSFGYKNVSYPKFDEIMQKNKKILAEIFKPEQLDVLEGIQEALWHQNRVATTGAAIGSPTAARLANATVLESLLGDTGVIDSIASSAFGRAYSIPAKTVRFLFKLRKKIDTRSTNEVMAQMLRDRNYAKLLLTKVKDLKTLDPSLMNILKTVDMPSSSMIAAGIENAQERSEDQ